MKSLEQEGSIYKLCRPTILAALALTIALLPILLAAQSAQAQTYRVLYSFRNAYPQPGLIVDKDGTLYGLTIKGGIYNEGTLFKLDTTRTMSVLHSFQVSSYAPFGLIRDSDGNFYTVTEVGGTYGQGSVVKIDPAGNETLLYSFTGGADGRWPMAGVIRDEAGNLYGTTYFGGDLTCSPPYGCGTVFKVDPAGNETVLHSFVGGTDGALPNPWGGLLIRDKAGNLYGPSTSGGGACGFTVGCGTVFKLDLNGNESVLYRFKGSPDDGYSPSGVLVGDSDGNLYGTTSEGGAGGEWCWEGCGTVFKLDRFGTETLLHSFNGSDGGQPRAGVIRDAAGNLYGVTQGYNYGTGVVFKLDTNGVLTVLHDFGSDYPQSLVMGRGGNLYGTTNIGGPHGGGTVFSIKLNTMSTK